ncbi:MAG: hypothetical protein RSH25_12815 [Bacteroides sp.]|uniref:hypothetical protein n=1 Tax=Bacteroides sp. TaxID=29523 RepID=UPI002FC7A415
MTEKILATISVCESPGFFITAEFSRTGEGMPDGIAAFIAAKLTLIREGSTVRKFVFQEGEWRIIFTFFPTDRVVEERYALKNKVMKRRSQKNDIDDAQ